MKEPKEYFVFLLLQVIHSEEYIGRPKVDSAAAACRKYAAYVLVFF